MKYVDKDSIPSNCRFEVDDFEDEWNYSVKFDLIHARAIVMCFKELVAVFKSAFDSLKPGDHLELQDVVLPHRAIDGTIKGTAMQTWTDLTIDAAAKLGTSWKLSGNYVRYF